MDITQGEALFYGGILGMVIVTALSIIVAVVLSNDRKRLHQKLNEEYGIDRRSQEAVEHGDSEAYGFDRSSHAAVEHGDSEEYGIDRRSHAAVKHGDSEEYGIDRRSHAAVKHGDSHE